jgi:hypothetical protein
LSVAESIAARDLHGDGVQDASANVGERLRK